jgi:sugar/nucleoside kinase (ribokinase family)
MGHKGAAAKCTGEPLFKMAPPTVAVIDTVGAGDSFDAGFIYGHLHHWDLERTLKLAVACGSLSTRAAGGTDAQPELKEVAEYLHQI